MARIPDIERRLLNWARWKAGEGAGGTGPGSGSIWDASPTRSSYREAIIPTNDVEAAQTDTAVIALAGELRAAVEAVYLRTGSIEEASRRLFVGVATIYRRVDLAHQRIAAWLVWRVDAARQERERVEKLSGQSSPRKKEFYEL